MLTVLEFGCLLGLALLAAGSLLNLSTSPHWFVRGWDFPRVQILVLSAVLGCVYFALTRFAGGFGNIRNIIALGLLLFLLVWHLLRILPYTVFSEVQSKRSVTRDTGDFLRILVSNVELENNKYDQWMAVVRREEPDVLIVLEADDVWMDKIAVLRRDYRHEIAFPQKNWYGMLMLSRLPVIDSEVRFLVEPDIPSIDAAIRLRSGQEIRVVGVHPRPPEPIRDNDSTGRDAELIAWAKLLSKEKRPVVIGGDLNDVAWSETTRLFLKISGLLDPRRGRGFFNTFHADHWWMRFPLDHLFHSRHFTLKEIRRLDAVGSDHFPILLELQFEPERAHEQEALEPSQEDHEHAEELLERKGSTELNQQPPGNVSATPRK